MAGCLLEANHELANADVDSDTTIITWPHLDTDHCNEYTWKINDTQALWCHIDTDIHNQLRISHLIPPQTQFILSCRESNYEIVLGKGCTGYYMEWYGIGEC